MARRVLGNVAASIVLATLYLAGLAAPATSAPYQLDGGRGRELVVTSQDALVIIPGSPKGSTPERARLLDQPDGIGQVAKVGSGDVNGDGDEDLVVAGAESGDQAVGRVAIIPGGNNGLLPDRTYHLQPDESWSWFGDEILVADVDRDGFDDVIASYWQTEPSPVPIGPRERTLRAAVFWGSPNGVSRGGALEVVVRTTAEADQPPLLLLGAGDVSDDANPELVLVDPGLGSENDTPRAGSMLVCRIDPMREYSCREPVEVAGGVGDVVVGDVVGGLRDDIVLGHPYFEFSGRIELFRSTASGLAPPVTVTPQSPGVPGKSGDNDLFGASLATANVDRDGKLDLAIGAPGRNNNAGRVTLLYGHRLALGQGDDTLIDQETSGVPGRSETDDNFGTDLSLVDTDGNGSADLVVGAFGEDNFNGAVTVVRATAAGRLVPRSTATLIRPGNVGLPREGSDRNIQLYFGNHIGS